MFAGSKLLDHVKQEASDPSHNIQHIYLHVSTDNHFAKAFYEKRGFVLVETVNDYYRDLSVKSAWLLRFDVKE
jgi:ribosomal protein S18 acetylase RimI-like enzyme